MIEGVYKIFNDLSLYGLEKLGIYLSKYRGFVANVDDPLGCGRLQLQVPDVYGDSTYTYWAWPANNFSGIGYGCQILPQTNDMVWVEFERGNPKKPLWSHGHFGKNEKPGNLKNPKNYWFKTPGGHLIELDDSAKAVTITDVNGNIITMDDSGIAIDAKDNPIFIGKSTMQVLYSKIPNSSVIADVSQIGVSQKIKVGI